MEDSCNYTAKPPRKRCFYSDEMWEDATLRQHSFDDLREWRYISRQIAVLCHPILFSTFWFIMALLTEPVSVRSFSVASYANLDTALFYSCRSDSVANKLNLAKSNPSCPCDSEHFERGGQRPRVSPSLPLQDYWIVSYCSSVTLIHCWTPYWCYKRLVVLCLRRPAEKRTYLLYPYSPVDLFSEVLSSNSTVNLLQ